MSNERNSRGYLSRLSIKWKLSLLVGFGALALLLTTDGIDLYHDKIHFSMLSKMEEL